MNAQNGAQGRVWPSLAQLLDGHPDVTNVSYENPYMTGHPACGCGWQQGDESNIGPYWRDHIEAAWTEACTIRTVEELESPPRLSIILDADQVVVRRDPWGEFSTVKWFPLDSRDSLDRDFGLDAEDVRLPALLIHNPDWSK